MGRSSWLSGAFVGINLGVSYSWQNTLHCILIHFIFIQSSIGQVPFRSQRMADPLNSSQMVRCSSSMSPSVIELQMNPKGGEKSHYCLAVFPHAAAPTTPAQLWCSWGIWGDVSRASGRGGGSDRCPHSCTGGGRRFLILVEAVHPLWDPTSGNCGRLDS